jgi:ABC-type branched-subunit amino acid transport system substrate-binding protein
MAGSIFNPQVRSAQIDLAQFLALVLALLISALPLVAAKASDDVIRLAVIDDLTGPTSARGDKVRPLFENYAKATNAKGGITVGQKSYKIEVLIYDAAGSPPKAAAAMVEAVQKDRVALAVCPHLACVEPAERAKTPLIFTPGKSNGLSHNETNTFLIWVPSPSDFVQQSNLAIKTLHEALTHATEPTPEKITAALRDVKIASDFGEVRFDKVGNNIGKAAYRFRPDTAGCSNSCGKTCPSNCGQVTCDKSGDNQCCSIRGMPRPNGHD